MFKQCLGQGKEFDVNYAYTLTPLKGATLRQV